MAAEDASGGEDTAEVIAFMKAQQELRGKALYEVRLDDEQGLRTEQIEAILYMTGSMKDPLVTFYDSDRPVASFNTKYVREIRLVRKLPSS